MPPGIAIPRIAGEMFLRQTLNSHKALESFSAFLTEHKGVCDYLYVNSLGIYQDLVVAPSQIRGEETGQKEIAMGFAAGQKDYVSIMAKEPTGLGWMFVSLVKRAGAERLRAKMSGLKSNFGGIRWKQIDIPYKAMTFMDPGVVFYKVAKLRKPGGDKAGYAFDFKANRGKAYIRFPYMFRSYQKLIEFVERGNGTGFKKWMRGE